jgi:hypothetical protein
MLSVSVQKCQDCGGVEIVIAQGDGQNCSFHGNRRSAAHLAGGFARCSQLDLAGVAVSVEDARKISVAILDELASEAFDA